jgi:hypothetical protein
MGAASWPVDCGLARKGLPRGRQFLRRCRHLRPLQGPFGGPFSSSFRFRIGYFACNPGLQLVRAPPSLRLLSPQSDGPGHPTAGCLRADYSRPLSPQTQAIPSGAKHKPALSGTLTTTPHHGPIANPNPILAPACPPHGEGWETRGPGHLGHHPWSGSWSIPGRWAQWESRQFALRRHQGPGSIFSVVRQRGSTNCLSCLSGCQSNRPGATSEHWHETRPEAPCSLGATRRSQS